MRYLLVILMLAGCAQSHRGTGGAIALNDSAMANLVHAPPNIDGAKQDLTTQRPILVNDQAAYVDVAKDRDYWKADSEGHWWTKHVRDWFRLIVIGFIVVWIGLGALVVFVGGPVGAFVANLMPVMGPFVWLAGKRK